MDSATGYFTAKKLLDDKYGDPYVISNAYLKKIAEWPNLKIGDDAALDRLATFLEQCLNAMTSLSYLGILDHPHNLQRLIVKLPIPLQDRWRREVVKIRGSRPTLPGLKDFVKFVQMEASFLVVFLVEFMCQIKVERTKVLDVMILGISKVIVQRR
jgi:hypothetical protein